MARYAESTSVSSDRSRAEIEKTLSRYGATGFMYGWEEDRAMIIFKTEDRQVKFILPLPNKKSPEFSLTPEKRRRRSQEQIEKAYEQAVRQRWRALSLVIKAKLEAVETGITSFDSEFMAHLVLPNGATIGEFMQPQIINAYETGRMPKMLPSPKELEK